MSLFLTQNDIKRHMVRLKELNLFVFVNKLIELFLKLYNIYNIFLQKKEVQQKENRSTFARKPDVFRYLHTNVYERCTKNDIVPCNLLESILMSDKVSVGFSKNYFFKYQNKTLYKISYNFCKNLKAIYF